MRKWLSHNFDNAKRIMEVAICYRFILAGRVQFIYQN
jgi:hypothetical protein